MGEVGTAVREDETDYELVHRIYRESVLIASAYRSMITDALVALSREFGLPSPVKFSQYDILCELYQNPGGHTPSDISARTGIKLPNVSSALAGLCELGLAERAADDADRRRLVVRLALLGNEFGQKVVERCSGVSQALLGSRADAEELLGHYARIEQDLSEC